VSRSTHREGRSLHRCDSDRAHTDHAEERSLGEKELTMSGEMAAVALDAANTAQAGLSAAGASRDDVWLSGALERIAGGRFLKAASHEQSDDDHIGAPMVLGGATGPLFGLVAALPRII
jgi:hypothetical protein